MDHQGNAQLIAAIEDAQMRLASLKAVCQSRGPAWGAYFADAAEDAQIAIARITAMGQRAMLGLEPISKDQPLWDRWHGHALAAGVDPVLADLGRWDLRAMSATGNASRDRLDGNAALNLRWALEAPEDFELVVLRRMLQRQFEWATAQSKALALAATRRGIPESEFKALADVKLKQLQESVRREEAGPAGPEDWAEIPELAPYKQIEAAAAATGTPAP